MHVKKVMISNFQSLRSVDLDLGKFTIIVGASSSGKTALLRAMKVLAENPRGSSFVTHGHKTAVITATLADGSGVTLEKGDGTAAYSLGSDKFTKLASTVPDQVRKALGFSAEDFADQFDRPFLLDDSGQAVARVFGDLTNVSVIFEAVREANRRKSASSSTLKVRQADLDKTLEQLQAYKGVKQRLSAVESAEKLVWEAQALDLKAKRLRSFLTDMTMAETALARAPIRRELPSLDPILAAAGKKDRFLSLINEISWNRKQITKFETQGAESAEALRVAEDDLHNYLVEIGRCPTCNQKIEGDQ